METVFHRQDLFIDCIQYHQLYTTTVEKIFFYIRIGNFVLGNKKKKKEKKKLFIIELHIIERQTFSIVKYRSRNLHQNSEEKRNFCRMAHDCYIVCLFPFISFSSLYQNIIIVN